RAGRYTPRGRRGRPLPDPRRTFLPDRRTHRHRRRSGDGGMNSDSGTLPATPAPIRFTTKAEAVYGEIRRRILSGVLAPSAPLNQEALAPEFGVSVTPVREA